MYKYPISNNQQPISNLPPPSLKLAIGRWQHFHILTAVALAKVVGNILRRFVQRVSWVVPSVNQYFPNIKNSTTAAIIAICMRQPMLNHFSAFARCRRAPSSRE